jgi:hypothetical protein
MPINIGNIFANSSRRLGGVELDLNHDFPGRNVKSASKAQDGRNLSLSATWFSDR